MVLHRCTLCTYLVWHAQRAALPLKPHFWGVPVWERCGSVWWWGRPKWSAMTASERWEENGDDGPGSTSSGRLDSAVLCTSEHVAEKDCVQNSWGGVGGGGGGCISSFALESLELTQWLCTIHKAKEVGVSHHKTLHNRIMWKWPTTLELSSAINTRTFEFWTSMKITVFVPAFAHEVDFPIMNENLGMRMNLLKKLRVVWNKGRLLKSDLLTASPLTLGRRADCLHCQLCAKNGILSASYPESFS